MHTHTYTYTHTNTDTHTHTHMHYCKYVEVTITFSSWFYVFHHISSWHWTQVTGFGKKHLLPTAVIFFSIIKHHDQKQPKKKRGLLSLHGQVMVHHCGMPREEHKQGRNLKVKTKAKTLKNIWLIVLLICLSLLSHTT